MRVLIIHYEDCTKRRELLPAHRFISGKLQNCFFYQSKKLKRWDDVGCAISMNVKIVHEFCIRMARKIGFVDDLNKMKCNSLDTTWGYANKNGLSKKKTFFIYGSGKNAMETGGKTDFKRVKTETVPQKVNSTIEN